MIQNIYHRIRRKFPQFCQLEWSGDHNADGYSGCVGVSVVLMIWMPCVKCGWTTQICFASSVFLQVDSDVHVCADDMDNTVRSHDHGTVPGLDTFLFLTTVVVPVVVKNTRSRFLGLGPSFLSHGAENVDPNIELMCFEHKTSGLFSPFVSIFLKNNIVRSRLSQNEGRKLSFTGPGLVREWVSK